MKALNDRVAGKTFYSGLLLLALLLSAGCGSSGSGSVGAPGVRAGLASEHMRTRVYECADGEVFTVRLEGEKAWLFLSSGTRSLPRVRSGSGVKFSDGSDIYWNKHDEVRVEVGGQAYRGCRNNRRRAVWEDAKFRGVDFRAVGNEPGWLLEISANKKVLFVHDYGQQKVEFALTAPVTDLAARTTRYRMREGGHRLSVTLEGRRCNDTMSDESFETTVELVFDGRQLAGCGRALH